MVIDLLNLKGSPIFEIYHGTLSFDWLPFDFVPLCNIALAEKLPWLSIFFSATKPAIFSCNTYCIGCTWEKWGASAQGPLKKWTEHSKLAVYVSVETICLSSWVPCIVTRQTALCIEKILKFREFNLMNSTIQAKGAPGIPPSRNIATLNFIECSFHFSRNPWLGTAVNDG